MRSEIGALWRNFGSKLIYLVNDIREEADKGLNHERTISAWV